MNDEEKREILRKICDAVKPNKEGLKAYVVNKGISATDVDGFIREGVIITDGAGHFITNEAYDPSAISRQLTPEPKPQHEPESEPETDENEIEPETKPIMQPSKTIDEILAEDFGENISPEVNTKAKTLLEDYLKANPTKHILKNSIRASVYLASNLLGHPLSQSRITRLTGASSPLLSTHIKKLAGFHNISVPFKVPQGNAAKIQYEQSAGSSSDAIDDEQSKYAPITVKGVEIPSNILEKLGSNQRTLLELIAAGKNQSAISEEMYYSEKGFRHAIHLLNKKLTQINVKVDLSVDGESLNKVITVEKERGDIDMTKEDSQFNYADIASAAKEAGINGKDKTALRNFAMQIYENAGSNHKAAYTQSYNFLTRLNQKGTLAKLATEGNIDNIKKYLPKQEDLEKRTEEKSAKSKAGAVDTKTEAPKPKKGSFFTYGDVALAIKENHIKEDDWLDFATAAYKNTGLSKQKSKSRAYAFKNYVKGDGEGLANVAKTGSLERIQKYLSKASQESVEDKTEETNEQDEARTPATTVKPFEAESLTDEQHILVTNITNDISRSLEFVLNMDLQPKDLSYINTKSKSFAQDIYAIGKTYVAQEETRVAGLKKRLEDFKTENNIPG
jgi:hypothetical protein